MTTPTNHWKLGLFVVASLLVGLGAVVYFGSRNLPKDTLTYVSYFDEAVTGLEIGSAVKYRGVTIGNISAISVAPDRRHVQVSYDLERSTVRQLSLEKAATEKPQLGTALRAQLASMGVTGNKYVALDMFEGGEPPSPLQFKPPPRYIPTQPSTLKNLESAVNSAADRLPELTEQLVVMIGRINTILVSVEQQAIPTRAVDTLQQVNQMVAVMQVKLNQFDAAGLSQQANGTLTQLQDTLGRVNRMLERVDGNTGVLANVERASLSMGDVARNASHVGNEAERTLREVAAAASAVRELADALERQPDMLLKGRARLEP